MEIPKLLIPEKNLDEKIEQLKENASIRKEEPIEYPLPAVGPAEVEKLLNDYDYVHGLPPGLNHSIDIDSEISDMLIKSGYKLVKHNRLKWYLSYDYWSKPTSSSESHILIKKYYKHAFNIGIYYRFARVQNNSIDEFLKRFEKHDDKGELLRYITRSETKMRNCCEAFVPVEKDALVAAFRIR